VAGARQRQQCAPARRRSACPGRREARQRQEGRAAEGSEGWWLQKAAGAVVAAPVFSRRFARRLAFATRTAIRSVSGIKAVNTFRHTEGRARRPADAPVTQQWRGAETRSKQNSRRQEYTPAARHVAGQGSRGPALREIRSTANSGTPGVSPPPPAEVSRQPARAYQNARMQQVGREPRVRRGQKGREGRAGRVMLTQR